MRLFQKHDFGRDYSRNTTLGVPDEIIPETRLWAEPDEIIPETRLWAEPDKIIPETRLWAEPDEIIPDQKYDFGRT